MSGKFEEVGAARFHRALSASETDRISGLFAVAGAPGERLGPDRLKPVADLICPSGPIGRIANDLLGHPSFAVRALLLDKSDAANWALGWHQDRTIAVKERIVAPEFGPWSIKRGQLHVQPPQSVIEAMITVRVHVDSVDEDNAPLRVIAGSHRLGRLTDAGVVAAVADGRELVCLAERGDVWSYRTPIIHASMASRSSRRRVLQLDYAATPLPLGLEWAMQLN